MRTRKKIYTIIGIFILMVYLLISVGRYQTTTPMQDIDNKEAGLDYGLIYNKDDYLSYNHDVAEMIDDEDAVMTHFLEYGMKEGRQASINFDVQYYRETNGDLGELYGEDLAQYYIHYMEYGYKEGRQGHPLEISPRAYQLTSTLEDASIVQLEYETSGEQYLGEKFFIFRLPAYAYSFDGFEPFAEGFLSLQGCIEIDLKSLSDKYVIAIRNNKEYKRISNFSYLTNPEVNSTSTVIPIAPQTKKGLQCVDEMLEDTLDLNLSHVFRNLVIQDLMCTERDEVEKIPFKYNERVYYFNKKKIEELDTVISSQTKAGITVTASIISIKEEGFEPLYYDGINMDSGASYYALDTTDEDGLLYVEAFVSFMSKRYDGTSEQHGLIRNWVVGNEVNESGTYNYMGEKPISDYLEEYTRTFRVIYNIVKSNVPFANIYVPMEPWWGIDSDMLTYGGKEFLDLFNAKIAHEGNIDWGLAYHAYSFPLSDPKVLNDIERTIDETNEWTLEGYVSSDSLNSVFISMENIEILTNYMNTTRFLTSNGEVRSIILSEQGYTSNSNVYGNCEALQAASMVYAYYKAEMNPDIDAFIYFLQLDNKAASLGNNYYRFGLWNESADGTLTKKYSHDIFRVMNSKTSLEQLEDMKDILGISEWEEIIPDFDETVFDCFNEVKRKTGTAIIQADINEIPAQKYTGRECLPEIKVSYKGNILVNNLDYDVVYHNNIEKGQAIAVIVGLNQYSGIKIIKFSIV